MDATLFEIDRKIRSVEAALEEKVQALPEYTLLRELKTLREKHVHHIEELQRFLGDEYSNSVPLIAACREIINGHSKPLQVDTLLRELEKRGIVVGGTNPRTDLAAKLSSAREVVYYIRGEGWWLTARSAELPQREKDFSEMRSPLTMGVEVSPSLRA